MYGNFFAGVILSRVCYVLQPSVPAKDRSRLLLIPAESSSLPHPSASLLLNTTEKEATDGALHSLKSGLAVGVPNLLLKIQCWRPVYQLTAEEPAEEKRG